MNVPLSLFTCSALGEFRRASAFIRHTQSIQYNKGRVRTIQAPLKNVGHTSPRLLEHNFVGINQAHPTTRKSQFLSWASSGSSSVHVKCMAKVGTYIYIFAFIQVFWWFFQFTTTLDNKTNYRLGKMRSFFGE